MELTLVWKELDKIMMSLFPTHARRMKFLAMRPVKGQPPSSFIMKLQEEARDAKIEQLTEAALILHLTTAGLLPGELTKEVEQIILEELRTNPNPNSKNLRDILEKIKGIEADHNAAEGAGKSLVRQVKEFKCNTCKKMHSRGECQYMYALSAKRLVTSKTDAGKEMQ